MTSPGRLDELIQTYVLGRHTETELEELSGYLKQDGAEGEAARRKLRLALKADVYLEEAAAEIGREIDSADGEPTRGTPADSVNRRWRWAVGGLAAAIAVAWFGWLRDSGAPRTGTPIELGVAAVLRIEGEALANQVRPLSSGDDLVAGDQLTMAEGLVELVFRDSGVHAIATAPLSLTAHSSERIFLHDGDIKLHVPPQGVGFVVETAEREITDLGTSFVVTARKKGSQVFVLDGQIAVEERNGVPGRLMSEGEVASFGQNGKLNLLSQKTDGLPELALPSMELTPRSLPGMILGFQSGAKLDATPRRPRIDRMGRRLAPLIESGFQNRNCLDGLKQGQPLRFAGIAGAYNQFSQRTELEPYASLAGWLSWYHGEVTAPGPGRYRFWGYADNNLLVAVDGKPVFDGSRYDSALREVARMTRQNHPAWPCLNARAGFAAGPWIEVSEDAVQLDILFGEVSGNLTSGLLLVEREGESYGKTFWGQPKWPLFLTEEPSAARRAELERLREHMEKKLMGSFSVSREGIWEVSGAE